MKTLRTIILDYINHSNGWINKGEIYMISQQEGYSPETGARTARLLAEEGLIKVSYYKSKRNIDLARYAPLDTPEPIKLTKVEPRIEEVNGIMMAIFEFNENKN